MMSAWRPRFALARVGAAAIAAAFAASEAFVPGNQHKERSALRISSAPMRAALVLHVHVLCMVYRAFARALML